MNTRSLAATLLAPLLAVALVPAVQAQSTSPQALLRGYEAQAGSAGQPARGQVFFTSRQGGEWSCASCHGTTPTAAGRHAVTQKSIDTLAPAFNPQAFTDPKRVEKWFRRNCKDVAQRECSAAEKADVLAWLLSLR